MADADKILAITKRPAELCGTQAVVYSAGYTLLAATNLDAAESVLRAVPITGVVVCRHSWSDLEQAVINSYLRLHHPEVGIIVHCSGCTGCDEKNKLPGVLTDTSFLRELLELSFSRQAKLRRGRSPEA